MNKLKELNIQKNGSNTPEFMNSPGNSDNNSFMEGMIKFKKNFNLSFGNSLASSENEEPCKKAKQVSAISNFQILSGNKR